MEKRYLEIDEWKIVEEGWDPANHMKSESIFSIGNGRMGQRANFEETYSGNTLQGSYVAGVYYPDKTKVGWWKNGYPEYFAKVLNSVNWIGINISVDGEQLDLNACAVSNFRRELDMQHGLLSRSFDVKFTNGKTLRIDSKRFLSLVRDEVGAIAYSFTPVNFEGAVVVTPYLDFDVENHDANWEEKFWDSVEERVAAQKGTVTAKTKKLDFQVSAAMRFEVAEGDQHITLYPNTDQREKFVSNTVELRVEQGKTYTIYKYAGITSSMNYKTKDLALAADTLASEAMRDGFDALYEEHANAWLEKWSTSDIIIDGDPAAQQAIRFNIFHLFQTFTGVDPRLNIGPKGFTGEKYGGSTYWDTEAYCLPFYLSTTDQSVARNLLIYRYNHLQKAIENAEKLGFTNGAALYPMVTMNGEECHNEWEITFEEIHRNGAIAYGIFNYVRHTLDRDYLHEYGFEVLLAISRFWAQRVNWSEARGKYVMLGVTGPNEYENNVNNNFYTNKMATWTMAYTLEVIDELKENHPDAYAKLVEKTHFDEETETKEWHEIIANIAIPFDDKQQVYLQQDGFLDKDLRPASSLTVEERPINQHWSWDRILRSCFIKQADVLQGLYFFEHQYDKATIRRNFDFYEPMTVHESSLSPCVHVILASRIGYGEKAYELYLRTARLDLDDYNREVHEGLHITSMAGTWMSVVQGFGGMKIIKEKLVFEPLLPEGWKALHFMLRWRGAVLKVNVTHSTLKVENVSDVEAEFHYGPHVHRVAANGEIKLELTK
ncbi:MAG: glycoside hydrolase family 65 protein [Bacteroidetes bacterium]|nr:MAG: glycoside hydrolase family 65 protein [Bacteroidota bacterium]